MLNLEQGKAVPLLVNSMFRAVARRVRCFCIQSDTCPNLPPFKLVKKGILVLYYPWFLY